MFQIKTILNPRAFSTPSLESHDVACDLARMYGAKVIFLHVNDEPVISYFDQASELSHDELQPELIEVLSVPRDFEAGLNIEHRIIERKPVEQILAVARQSQCDLIVMGTHEAGGIAKWFSGTVTEQVIRKADCSVLVARAVPQHLQTTTAS